MIAPVALQPAAANTTRHPYRAVYSTKAGALLAAQREARSQSPVWLCQRAIDLGQTDVWCAVDGDARYLVELDTIGGDWVVRAITAAEVTRMQQAHLRGEVADYYEEAERCTAEAVKRPDTSAVRREMFRRAREMRELAREVELKLILGAVIDCEITSSDRDSREAVSL